MGHLGSIQSLFVMSTCTAHTAHDMSTDTALAPCKRLKSQQKNGCRNIQMWIRWSCHVPDASGTWRLDQHTILSAAARGQDFFAQPLIHLLQNSHTSSSSLHSMSCWWNHMLYLQGWRKDLWSVQSWEPSIQQWADDWSFSISNRTRSSSDLMHLCNSPQMRWNLTQTATSTCQNLWSASISRWTNPNRGQNDLYRNAPAFIACGHERTKRTACVFSIIKGQKLDMRVSLFQLMFQRLSPTLISDAIYVSTSTSSLDLLASGFPCIYGLTHLVLGHPPATSTYLPNTTASPLILRAAADAYAEGGYFGIGGWIITSKQVGWFSEQFTMGELRQFKRELNKDAQRYICAFEVLAQLALLMMGHEMMLCESLELCLPSSSDNTAAGSGINRHLSTKEPTSSFLQLMCQYAMQRHIHLMISHSPGHINTWADDISRDKLSQWRSYPRPRLRVTSIGRCVKLAPKGCHPPWLQCLTTQQWRKSKTISHSARSAFVSCDFCNFVWICSAFSFPLTDERTNIWHKKQTVKSTVPYTCEQGMIPSTPPGT